MQRSNRRLMVAAVSLSLAAPAVAQNLLQNPGFNTDLSGWTLNAGNGSITWNALDANGAASSGSARLVTPAADGMTTNSIQQCVAVSGGADYVLSAKVFRGQGVLVSAFGAVVWYAGAGCGAFLAEDNPLTLFAPGSGA